MMYINVACLVCEDPWRWPSQWANINVELTTGKRELKLQYSHFQDNDTGVD